MSLPSLSDFSDAEKKEMIRSAEKERKQWEKLMKIEDMEQLTNAIKEQGLSNEMALIYAAAFGNMAAVEMLLAGNVNRDVFSMPQMTSPLITALSNGRREISLKLLEAGFDAQKKAPNGDTALILASVMGDDDIVQRLLDLNCSPFETNKSGATALLLSAKGGHWRVFTTLLDFVSQRLPIVVVDEAAGANEQNVRVINSIAEILNIGRLQGRSALHWAAIAGNGEMTSLLLSNGADALLRDPQGKLAVDLAVNSAKTVLKAEMLRLERLADLRMQQLEKEEAIENKSKGSKNASNKKEKEKNVKTEKGKAKKGDATSSPAAAVVEERKKVEENTVVAQVVEEEEEQNDGDEGDWQVVKKNLPHESDATTAAASKKKNNNKKKNNSNDSKANHPTATVPTKQQQQRPPTTSVSSSSLPSTSAAAQRQQQQPSTTTPRKSYTQAISQQETALVDLPDSTVDDNLAQLQREFESLHPRSADLSLSVENILGIGLHELSPSQLDAIEDILHDVGKRVSEAKVDLARKQEQERAANQRTLIFR